MLPLIGVPQKNVLVQLRISSTNYGALSVPQGAQNGFSY